MVHNTKLHELLDFPCDITLKIVGDADPLLDKNVICTVQNILPGDYKTTIKKSTNGNYFSVSITINVQNINQVNSLYQELGNLPSVKMVL